MADKVERVVNDDCRLTVVSCYVYVSVYVLVHINIRRK